MLRATSRGVMNWPSRCCLVSLFTNYDEGKGEETKLTLVHEKSYSSGEGTLVEN